MKNKKDNLSRRGFMKFVGNLGGGVVASKLSSKILTSKVLAKRILSSNAIKTLGLSLPFGAAFMPSRSEAVSSFIRGEYDPYLIESYLLYNHEYWTKMSKEALERELEDPALEVDKKLVYYNKDKFPPIGDTLKFKGNLRISWSFDIAYNKNIDLIFFMEENNYLKYALLHAKDFEKYTWTRTIKEKSKIPYNINYDFVKEILSKSGLSEYQQKKFLDSRFGSVFVPMEIEFEWYVMVDDDSHSRLNEYFTFDKYDEFLQNNDFSLNENVYYCLGIIKSHKILPKNTKLNFEEMLLGIEHSIFNPLPNTALAITKTLEVKFISVFDKPDSKNGKILAKLPRIAFYSDEEYQAKSKYDIKLAKETERINLVGIESNQANAIEPVKNYDYLVFIQKILPNNWCKVLVLKVPDGLLDTLTTKAFGTQTASSLQEWHGSPFPYNTKKCKAYMDKFYNQISTITLADGYIHSSGLDYLAPFPRD